MSHVPPRYPLRAAVLALSACTGTIGQGAGAGPADRPSAPPAAPGAGRSGKPEPTAAPASESAPDGRACAREPIRAPLRRLTRAEYDNTVRDLLQTTQRLAGRFPEDERVGPFLANADSPVGVEHVDQFMYAAEALAAEAVRDLGRLDPCFGDGTSAEACAQKAIRELGARAWRRPLGANDQQDLLALYRQGQDARGGMRLVIEALLQSPDFLYLVEGRATAGGTAPLTAHELATRLSYFLWDRPDPRLFQLAAEGALASPAVLQAEVARMLGSPNAEAVIADFHAQWLVLHKLGETTIDATMRAAMLEESARFVREVYSGAGDARIETLLAAPYTFVNAALAKHYGLPPVAGAGFVRVPLDAGQRAGLLGHASFLAAHGGGGQNSEIFRGLVFREELLCTPLPPPIPGAADQTELDRLKTEPCRGCHVAIDPLGLPFKQYDAAGRFLPAARPRGDVAGTLDADGTYTSATQLQQAFARSRQVRQCVGAQWLRYALGAGAGWDHCAVEAMIAAAGGPALNLRQLVVQLVLSDAFRMRSPP